MVLGRVPSGAVLVAVTLGCGGGARGPARDAAAVDGSPARVEEDAGAPAARRAVPMAFDPLREEVVLFGGWGASDAEHAFVGLGDQWAFRGGRWAALSGCHPWPRGRGSFGMVFDRARGEVVMMGGSPGGETEQERVGSALAETWAWSGRAWRLASTSDELGERVDHALAYDAARDEIVLFGGVRVVFKAETWVWAGREWARRDVPGPAARAYVAMAFDEVRGEVVLFGGFNHRDVLGDTWVWDGQAWSERHPAVSPPARRSTGMAWDPVRQQVLLFGGTQQGEAMENGVRVPDAGAPLPEALDDTWAWDGQVWQPLAPAHRPPPRRSLAITTDPGGRRVLLFGGIRGVSPFDQGAMMYGDAWQWDGEDWRRGW